ncbi:MAG: hypothetical protein KY476_02355 [Planctomycetes bacterium]|nr:hypothetical protein [Planctomycetota bacterium]
MKLARSAEIRSRSGQKDQGQKDEGKALSFSFFCPPFFCLKQIGHIRAVDETRRRAGRYRTAEQFETNPQLRGSS